jgi:hypothetical protein
MMNGTMKEPERTDHQCCEAGHGAASFFCGAGGTNMLKYFKSHRGKKLFYHYIQYPLNMGKYIRPFGQEPHHIFFLDRRTEPLQNYAPRRISEI